MEKMVLMSHLSCFHNECTLIHCANAEILCAGRIARNTKAYAMETLPAGGHCGYRKCGTVENDVESLLISDTWIPWRNWWAETGPEWSIFKRAIRVRGSGSRERLVVDAGATYSFKWCHSSNWQGIAELI